MVHQWRLPKGQRSHKCTHWVLHSHVRDLCIMTNAGHSSRKQEKALHRRANFRESEMRTDGRTDRQQGKISKSEEVVIEMGSDRDYNTCRRLVDAMALSIVCICASKTLETLKQITLGRKPSQASLVSSWQRTPPLCARLLPLSLSLLMQALPKRERGIWRSSSSVCVLSLSLCCCDS
jgi:hypothetical protein